MSEKSKVAQFLYASLYGTYLRNVRFHEEFAVGVTLMQKGLINVTSLITHSFSLADYAEAFTMA